MKQTQAQRFGLFLKAILERLGWTQDELERRGGPSREAVGRHLRAVDDPEGDRVPEEIGRGSRVKYAEAFDCDPDGFEALWKRADELIELGSTEALYGVVSTLVGSVQKIDGLPHGSDFDPLAQSDLKRSDWLPRLGTVAAGKPTDFELDVLGDKNIPPTLYNSPQELPATIVASGNSMHPMIKDGDIVVIARRFHRAPKTGDIVAISRVQEAGHSIKHLEILKDGRWLLKPQNSHDFVPETLELDQIKAAAVVCGWYHAVHKPMKTPRK